MPTDTPHPRCSRRAFLGGLAAGSGLTALGGWPATAWASAADQRRFVFVTAFGGWDPTRVFAPQFDSPGVAMEASAQLAEVGDLRWVSHADRPSVDRFFESWGHRSAIVNGVVVPSVSHVTCTRLLFTSSSTAAAPGWPARLAHARADAFPLPQVVVDGPHFPQRFGPSVTRVGASGAVEALLRGDLLEQHDGGVTLPGADVRALLDRHATQRAELRLHRARSTAEERLVESFLSSGDRATTLEGLVDEIRFGEDNSFQAQIDVAVDLLRLDISRVVSVALADLTWDSHQDNDPKQSTMFEALFEGLVALQQALEDTPSVSGGTLAEETVIVVLSEMGRTPHLNNGEGKDHWSHTSVLVSGAGVAGGRVVGGYSDLYTSEPVDPLTGEVTAAGVQIDPDVLGASLLSLGGVALEGELGGDLADADPLVCLQG